MATKNISIPKVKQLKPCRDEQQSDCDLMYLRMYDGNYLSFALTRKYIGGKHESIEKAYGYHVAFREALTLKTEVDEDGYVTAAEFETFCKVVTNDYHTRPNFSLSPYLDEYFRKSGYPSASVSTPENVVKFFRVLLREVPIASDYFKIEPSEELPLHENIADGKLRLTDGTTIDTYSRYYSIEDVISTPLKEELFYQNVHLFIANADRILSDSRLFLTPIPVDNAKAFRPILGAYIEWWRNYPKESHSVQGDPIWKIVAEAGSEEYKFYAVDKDGKSYLAEVENPAHSRLTYRRMNGIYYRAKRAFFSYSLTDAIQLLRPMKQETIDEIRRLEPQYQLIYDKIHRQKDNLWRLLQWARNSENEDGNVEINFYILKELITLALDENIEQRRLLLQKLLSKVHDDVEGMSAESINQLCGTNFKDL